MKDNYKKIIIGAGIVIIILLFSLSIIRHFKNFEEAKLLRNKKEIFSISDLTLNDLKFGSKEDEIVKSLGKPLKEKKITKDIYEYKILSYKGLELTLKENYDNYILVGMSTTSKKYKIGRNLRVNKSIYKAVKKFKIENKRGTYLYGNYTVKKLDESEVKENIYMGVRGSEEVIYINKDAKIDGIKTNIARLTLSYKKGKIKKISWSYDFE